MVTLAEDAAAKEPQGGVRHRAAAAAASPPAADIAPILRGAVQPARTATTEGAWRRLDPRFPHQRRDPQLRQRRGPRALQPGRRDHARPHHPHQELAADRCRRRTPASSTTSRKAARDAAQQFIDELQGLFRAPQRPRRRRPKNARSAAARRAGAGARPVRARPHRQGRRASPPTSPRPRSKASPMPKRSAASSRSAKPTCSTANTGRWSRPSSARAKPLPLAGQVAVITGGGGAIGAATAQAFAAAGAEVALLDLDDEAAQEQAKAIGGNALAVALRRHRCRLGARGLRQGRRSTSAASISWSRTPARPGRAASARSTKRCCARASS